MSGLPQPKIVSSSSIHQIVLHFHSYSNLCCFLGFYFLYHCSQMIHPFFYRNPSSCPRGCPTLQVSMSQGIYPPLLLDAERPLRRSKNKFLHEFLPSFVFRLPPSSPFSYPSPPPSLPLLTDSRPPSDLCLFVVFFSHSAPHCLLRHSSLFQTREQKLK